jgi:hypothetical protein
MLQTTSNPKTPSRPLEATEPNHATKPSQLPDQTTCRFELLRVVCEIDSQPIRIVVDSVFNDLLRLLECLAIIENHLKQVDDADETFAFFRVIHDEARTLVNFIREDALNCQAMHPELVDTLDGITFAVSHDLQRVFEADQASALTDKPPHTVIGKLYRAHDIMTNCLQQSTITLAMTFDPDLVGAKLFNNSDMRYRQSLQLCDDLSVLLHLVQACEKNSAEALPNLSAGMKKFRSESLEYLMYSDWPQFESFCERINLAGMPQLELESVLHQFHCYVETLLGQVRMRAVLANVFPVQFGADASTAFYAPNSLEDGDPSWDGIAVAV